MSNFIQSIEGTELGQLIALGLALWAAVIHAIVGALQKAKSLDPWVARSALDICYGLFAFPFIFIVPWPEPYMWPLFAASILVHFCYKFLQAKAFENGAFTVVYPVMRGLSPVVTVCFAYVVFSEVFTITQWVGIGVLLCGIFGLSFYNLRQVATGRQTLFTALIFAVLTGFAVATYTTVDAYAVRATADPFTFLAWFFFLDGFNFSHFGVRRYLKMTEKPPMKSIVTVGVLGGIFAPLSFGAIILATRLDKVGEAAVLRETSTVFAALIGWLMLGEKVGLHRFVLMALIALGAVIVEIGG